MLTPPRLSYATQWSLFGTQIHLHSATGAETGTEMLSFTPIPT